jgi:hypothetical protein
LNYDFINELSESDILKYLIDKEMKLGESDFLSIFDLAYKHIRFILADKISYYQE